MSLLFSLILSFILLVGTAYLNCFNSALRLSYLQDSKLHFLGKRFFYGSIHRFFFPEQKYEEFLFSILSTLNVTRIFYGLSLFFIIISSGLLSKQSFQTKDLFYSSSVFWIILILIIFILFSLIIGELLPKLIGTRYPENSVKATTPVVSIFLTLSALITIPFLKLSQKYLPKDFFAHLLGPLTPEKQEIMELIQKTKISPDIKPHEKDLIESVLTFKDRIVREIMVPRVDVFSLPAETSIKDAAKLIEEEGYSRVPVHRGNVDNIVGVLMYKDIVNKYMEYEENKNDQKILEATIETIQKNVMYTPETKKISYLLEDFLRKTVHFAVVVDEYGGTEGIVTIEDIIEEIVGEIADEYDEIEELFIQQTDGSWIVDARMSILDVEEQMGVSIPQEADYDTVGGYIFHIAGAIPEKGFEIHQQEFEMKILSSSDRSVDKVRMKSVTSNTDLNKQNS